MIDPAILCAFIDVESSFVRGAFLNDRSGGSYGLTQLDLATAEDRGYKGTALGLYDPLTNITFFCKHIAWLTAELTKAEKYSVENLAAAYNSGLNHVLGGGSDPAYSAKISAALAKWTAALTQEPH